MRSTEQFTGIIPVDVAEGGFTPTQLRWLRALGYMPPIAGGDGEGDGQGAGSGEGSGGGEGSGEGQGESSAEAEGEGEGEDDNDEDGEDENDHEGHDNDRLEMSRSEYERLKRIAREHDREKKKRERDERKRQEQRRKEQGEYDVLLKEKDEQIATVESERDEARFQLDSYKRRIRVQNVATRLGFKDADDAHRFLSDEDTEDDVSTERALKSLSKKKPYLVSERRSTGAPVNGEGAILTKADMERMTPEEINTRWEEVQKSLASGIS